MIDALWLAWEDDSSIRSRVLAAELGAKFRPLTAFDGSRWFGWLRYPTAVLLTLWTLARRRPRLVIVQNPSILLAFEAALLRRVFGYRLVVDLHTPFAGRRGVRRLIADSLHGFGLRHCDAVIVTNDALRARVTGETDRPVFVLPDRIPNFDRPPRQELRGSRHILFICTFSNDEPWREVLLAARDLPPDTVVYISGRHRLDPADVPTNVVLTGFLPTADYHRILQSVDAVMVLTTAEDNLVCGGYEAVAAEKPMILSDTSALRKYFRRGAVFTRNERNAIAAATIRTMNDLPQLSSEVRLLKQELTIEWDVAWARLLQHLGAPDRADHSP